MKRPSRARPAPRASTRRGDAASRAHRRVPVNGRRQALPPARVAVAYHPTAAPTTILESALQQSGFWTHLGAAQASSGRPRERFSIVIKPDLGGFDGLGSRSTDPALVEHLIDLLWRRSYRGVAVGDGPDAFAPWFENRDVLPLADLVGYRFRTSDGHPYEVLDLSCDLVSASFPSGAALHGTSLARPWLEADYRICFAKSKTDEEDAFALGLHCLLNVLPLRDKHYHYRLRRKPWDLAIELLRRTPVHFTIVDAFVSNHGGAGSRISRPLVTRTVLAGGDLLMVETVAAGKMGLDVSASRLMTAAVRAFGSAQPHVVGGPRETYPDFVTVHPLLLEAARRRADWGGVSRTLRPWLQCVDATRFPCKSALDAQVNGLLAPWLGRPDDNPIAFWALVTASALLAALQPVVEIQRTLYAKDRLQRQEAPLNVDPAAYGPSDFEAISAELEPLARRVREIPLDGHGLRWRELDGSTIFEFARVIPIRFTDFVARVDIARAIEFMNDYLGGVAVPVTRDRRGRVVHQIERNVYLPQPNYVAFYQAKTIDVTKLELVRYETRRRTIMWKTILSANESARFDDGWVTFAATRGGETRVTVFGRQQFVLPPALEALRLELMPAIRDWLVTHAYTTFFSRTLANFEAVYEGRDIRIGCPWRDGDDVPDPAASSAAAWLARLAVAPSALAAQLATFFARERPVPSRTDEDGFRHFAGLPSEPEPNGHKPLDGVRPSLSAAGRDVGNFLMDLARALQHDLGVT